MKLQERVSLFQERLQRVSLFLGKLYVIVNNIDHIRKITDRFDDLIRMAVIHPHEIRDLLQGLLHKCE